MSDKPKSPVHPITKRILAGTKTATEKRSSKATSHYLKLPAKLRRAVDTLVNGGTQSEAARAAGYPAKSSLTTLRVRGWQIAHRPDVMAAVAEREREAREDAGLTLTRSWIETRRIAYLDAARLFDKRGNILSPAKLDEDTRAAVASFDIEERSELVKGKRITVKTTRVKFWNKVEALKMHLRSTNAVAELPSVVVHNETHITQTSNVQVNANADSSTDNYDRLLNMTPVDGYDEYRQLMGYPAPDPEPPSTPAMEEENPVVEELVTDTPRQLRRRIRREARASVDETLEIWKKLGEAE